MKPSVINLVLLLAVKHGAGQLRVHVGLILRGALVLQQTAVLLLLLGLVLAQYLLLVLLLDLSHVLLVLLQVLFVYLVNVLD